MREPNERHTSPLWERIVAVVLATGVIISFVYFVVNPPAENSTALPIIRFLAATASGLSAFLFVGGLDLEATLPFKKGAVRAAGGFAVFIAVFFLFFYGIPGKNISVSSTSPPPESISVAPTNSPSPSVTASATNGVSVNKQTLTTKSSLIVILDASGSMKEIFGKQSRIDAAKKAVEQIVGKLPSDRKFGLTVYGNGSSNSCSSLKTLVDLGSRNQSVVLSQLSNVKAEGKTPIAASIQEVAKAIKNHKQETTIVLISDGEESCGGDPCQVVKQLKSEGYKFIFHGIGVDTTLQADQQLSCLAREGDGVYLKADPGNPGGILEELERVALGGQFRIRKPKDLRIDGWKLIPSGSNSQEPVLLVRKQSDSQLWGTYPLDRGSYDVYIFIRDQQSAAQVGQAQIIENQITEFDTRR